MVLADVTDLFNLWSLIGCFISKHVSSLRVSVTAKKKASTPGVLLVFGNKTGADVCFPDVVFGEANLFCWDGWDGCDL